MTLIALQVLFTKDEEALKFEEQHSSPDYTLELDSGLQDHGLRSRVFLVAILPQAFRCVAIVPAASSARY